MGRSPLDSPTSAISPRPGPGPPRQDSSGVQWTSDPTLLTALGAADTCWGRAVSRATLTRQGAQFSPKGGQRHRGPKAGTAGRPGCGTACSLSSGGKEAQTLRQRKPHRAAPPRQGWLSAPPSAPSMERHHHKRDKHKEPQMSLSRPDNVHERKEDAEQSGVIAEDITEPYTVTATPPAHWRGTSGRCPVNISVFS